MKQITIAGNIGRDAEVRHTQGGDSVAGFSVAVEDRRGQEKTTLWFDVSVWGKRGQALAPYLTKGGRVCVSGDLSTREHDGKTYMQVRADQVTLMGGGQSEPDRSRTGAGSEPSGYGAGGRPGDSIEDDEIPFAPEFRA